MIVHLPIMFIEDFIRGIIREVENLARSPKLFFVFHFFKLNFSIFFRCERTFEEVQNQLKNSKKPQQRSTYRSSVRDPRTSLV